MMNNLYYVPLVKKLLYTNSTTLNVWWNNSAGGSSNQRGGNMKVYIFAKIKPGKEKEVINSLKRVDEVKHSQLLFGEHDAVFEVHVEQHEDLRQVLLNKVRPIDGIEKTKTCLTFEH